MIAIQDVRVGNLIEEGEIECIYLESRKFEVVQNGARKFIDAFFATPIPITEEWLIKAGFECIYKSNYSQKWELLNFPFIGFEKDGKEDLVFIYYGKPIPLSLYIHKLQNLVYELSGQELTIKE